MASLLEEIADALARDALRAVEQLGDDNLIAEIARLIGSSSSTTQEAFLTAVRIRMAEGRARKLLAERLGASWPLEPAGGPIAGLRGESPPGPMPSPTMTSPPDQEPRPAGPPAIEGSARPLGAAPQDLLASQIRAPVEAMVPAAKPVPPATAPEAEIQARDEAGRIRPRAPAAISGPLAPSSPAASSLEAALALATSQPRKPVSPAAPQARLPTPYDDIEMPDGDWG